MKHKILIGVALLTSAFLLAACDDDDDYSVSTERVVKSITTGDATVTAISAVTTGTVSDLSKIDPERYKVGTVYGTSDDPTKSGTYKVGTVDELGNVTTTLTGLTEGATYYYATYVTLQSKVTEYGEVKSFIATDADVATAAATGISACHATFNGQATGVSDILDKVAAGFKYSTAEDGVQDGVNLPLDQAAATFTLSVKNLLPGTTYYYAAYTKVGDSVIYGNTQSFTTMTQEMEYVDLGTSVLWAKCNIGAEAESKTGILVGFSDQTFYSTSQADDDYTPWDIAGTDEDVIYNLSIDGTATKKSCTPTAAQMNELISKTTQTVETVDGVAGIRFTAKNGNSIFLPYTGYRDGASVTANGAGYYWTGSVSDMDEALAKSLKVSQGAGVAFSARHLGLAVRSVRPAPEIKDIDNTKLAVGDIEGNGRIRIEIYNDFGTTKAAPGISTDQIVFNKNMVVTFKLTGLDDNYKEGATKSNIAGLEYSDPQWAISHWSALEGDKYDANVTGDGTYTVWMETEAGTSGAIVFCVDIKDLYNDLVDPSLVKAEIVSIKFDVDPQFYMDFSKTEFVNKDGNGTDGRIEIYNEYGNTKVNGVDASGLSFTGNMIVNFTISGIDGNQIEGASESYKTELSFADADWSPSYWGGSEYGRAQVSGDGTYEVFASLNGECEDAVVWTIEIYNLWKELVDPAKVSVTINSVTTPGK